ncbi:Uncharacterized protein FKW44_024800, partial [Caligus rogercresseyi]
MPKRQFKSVKPFPRATAALRSVITAYGFNDAADVVKNYDHTFFSVDKLSRPTSSRIDLFLFKGFKPSDIKDHRVIDTKLSDHRALFTKIGALLPSENKCKKLWKLNASLLECPEVNRNIIDVIETANSYIKSAEDVFSVVEKMFNKIRCICRQAGARKAEKQKRNLNQIENTSKQIMTDSEKAFKLKQIYQEHDVTHRIKLKMNEIENMSNSR